MIIKKYEVEAMFKNIEKIRTFYAKKYETAPINVNFIIQKKVIFVMVNGESKEYINKVQELKCV